MTFFVKIINLNKFLNICNNMNIKDIKVLKDKVYELEGLLELAQLREDRISELEPLILSRLNDLRLPCGEDREEAVETVEKVSVVSDSLFPDPEVTAPAPEIPVKPTSEKVSIVEPEKVSIVEPGKVSIVEPEEPRRSYPVQDQLPAGDFTSTARKPAFCLNDRFRFRRELFANSDAEFSAAMNMVASMENYEEAEEYFLGELGWNPEKQEVVDFLAVISQYLGK